MHCLARGMAIAALLLASATARADPVDAFYRGKTIRLIVGSAAGGGYDIVARVIASGTPLRSSPKFMAMFDRLDHSAQTWGVVNGNSRLMKDFEDGPRPKTIDGTLKATDKLVASARIEMAEPGDAVKFHSLISKDLDRASGFMQVHSAKVSGSTVTVDLAMTAEQIETALAFLGVH